MSYQLQAISSEPRAQRNTVGGSQASSGKAHCALDCTPSTDEHLFLAQCHRFPLCQSLSHTLWFLLKILGLSTALQLLSCLDYTSLPPEPAGLGRLKGISEPEGKPWAPKATFIGSFHNLPQPSPEGQGWRKKGGRNNFCIFHMCPDLKASIPWFANIATQSKMHL